MKLEMRDKEAPFYVGMLAVWRATVHAEAVWCIRVTPWDPEMAIPNRLIVNE